MRVLVDLDDTLLDTYKWWASVWSTIADNYPGISKSEGAKPRLREFYMHFEGRPSTYDFHGHLDTLGLLAHKSDIYDLVVKDLSSQTLDYNGVAEFIEQAERFGELTVVTFGIEDIQKLKVASRPLLQQVDMATTLDFKPDVIAQMKQGSPDVHMVVIDDANIGQQLQRSNVDFIWATWSQTAHSRNQRKGLEPWPVEAKSLEQAAQLLDLSFNKTT